MWRRIDSRGARVEFSRKSDTPPSGHQRVGIAPFGKNINAVRSGAPVAVVANRAVELAANERCGISELKAGNATHAPSPRKKCRRFIAANRCSAAQVTGTFMVFGARNR